VGQIDPLIHPKEHPMSDRKRCAKCSTVKALEDFHKSSRSPDGHQSWCKSCAKEASENRRQSKPQRGQRKAAFDKWLLTGLMEGYITADEARRLT
jgi:hypothetical protein